MRVRARKEAKPDRQQSLQPRPLVIGGQRTISASGDIEPLTGHPLVDNREAVGPIVRLTVGHIGGMPFDRGHRERRHGLCQSVEWLNHQNHGGQQLNQTIGTLGTIGTFGTFGTIGTT